VTGRELQGVRRRELGLVGLRWLLVIYAAVQAWAALQETTEPEYVEPLAITLAVGLAVGNLAVASGTLRATRMDQLRAIGVAAFLLDCAVILGLLWTTTLEPSDPVWVIGYLLPLEGAARYGLSGALVGAAVFGGSEALREQYLPQRFPPYAFDGSALAYRIGMGFVVAVVAGGFARSLRRETRRANERAEVAEALARSEADARARLEELDVMKTDFIAITSHELRTPISSIRGFVDTLRRRRHTLPESQIDEFLAIVHLQGDRLARLVEDLLTVSRLEAGVLTLSPEPTEVHTLLHEVVAGLGDDATRVDWHAEPEPGTIQVDPQRLGQVLTNLLTNALKFSPAHRRVVVRARPAPHDRLTFTVVDHGGGIPPEQLDRIFERFHQAQDVQRRQAEGVGLGLYITKELVEQMGGEVHVSSTVGAGTTFTVTIPRVPPDPIPAPALRS
jgi:signal transduction histidine kinase